MKELKLDIAKIKEEDFQRYIKELNDNYVVILRSQNIFQLIDKLNLFPTFKGEQGSFRLEYEFGFELIFTWYSYGKQEDTIFSDYTLEEAIEEIQNIINDENTNS